MRTIDEKSVRPLALKSAGLFFRLSSSPSRSLLGVLVAVKSTIVSSRESDGPRADLSECAKAHLVCLYEDNCLYRL